MIIELERRKIKTKAISVGSGISVSPAVFKYPLSREQSFTATITSDDPYKYYVRITIDGVSTDYDITTKPFTLSNTTADTTVSIAKVLKSSRLVDVNTDVIPENYVALTGGEMLTYYYPVSNSQTVHSEVHYAPDPFSGPSGWTAATATFTWYVNDVLFAQHTAVQYSDFSIATASSSTIVRLELTNFAGGGSGGGGEGGGGYISWYALTNADYIIRSSPSVSSGSYVAGTFYTTQVQVTDQGSGDEISGSNLWYKVTITNNPMNPNTVGLSGWIHRFGVRSGTNPN